MTTLQVALFRAAAQTFEDLSFLLPLPEAAPEPPEGIPLCVASVEFVGPFSGQLAVTATDDLLDVVTSNMLGEDDISEGQRYDALMEIANVICGNLLPLIAGHEAVFHMTAPQVAVFAHDSAHSCQATAHTAIALDDGWAHVALYVQEEALIKQVLVQ